MDVVAAGGSFACMSVATSKNPSLRISVSGTLYAPNTRNGAHFLYLKQKKMISVSKCSAKVENVNEYADGRLVEAMEDKQLRASAAIFKMLSILEVYVTVQDRALALCTQLLQFENTTDPFHALSTPLYQTATFKQPSATEVGQYDYTRSGNPSRDALESLLAKLEGADQAFCFTSGMAALATATHLVKAGEEIVAGDDIYGGSDRLLSKITPKAGVVIKRVDMSNVEDVRAAINLLTRIVWLESPTNPRQQISDIREIAKIAHSYGALLLVDNSIMSPVLSKPLELGADIVMHSATKFIAGHSDLMAGVLAVKDPGLAQEIYFLQNAQGTGLSPFDCWLCLRGIKTLVLRVEKQQANAQKIAEFLDSHPKILQVNYAGLPQCKGAGSVLSFTTGNLSASKHIAEKTSCFSITVSFGSVKSLISLPCFMSHASIPTEVRNARGLHEDLVRLSVGIEDVDDLIADLSEALQTAPWS